MSVSFQEFVNSFSEKAVDHVVDLDIGGARPLPVMLNSNPGAKTLVVIFHGAYERSRYEMPNFLDRVDLGVSAHRLSVADPSLEMHDRLALGWFAGDEELPLQTLLPSYLRELAAELSIERVLFMGSSGGGYAALFYSWHFEDSVAVVKIPQTRILKYRHAAYDRYLKACWPNGVESYGEKAPVLDLLDLYSKGMNNQVVFIQNAFDYHHLYEHMTPFVASLPEESRDRLLVKTSYWGKQGHSNSVPLLEWDTWGRAAAMAPTNTAIDIADAYLRLNLEKGPKLGEFKKGSGGTNHPRIRQSEIADMDLEWARMVVESQVSGRAQD